MKAMLIPASDTEDTEVVGRASTPIVELKKNDAKIFLASLNPQADDRLVEVQCLCRNELIGMRPPAPPFLP